MTTKSPSRWYPRDLIALESIISSFTFPQFPTLYDIRTSSEPLTKALARSVWLSQSVGSNQPLSRHPWLPFDFRSLSLLFFQRDVRSRIISIPDLIADASFMGIGRVVSIVATNYDVLSLRLYIFLPLLIWRDFVWSVCLGCQTFEQAWSWSWCGTYRFFHLLRDFSVQLSKPPLIAFGASDFGLRFGVNTRTILHLKASSYRVTLLCSLYPSYWETVGGSAWFFRSFDVFISDCGIVSNIGGLLFDFRHPHRR